MTEPTEKSLKLIHNFVDKFCKRTGLQLHSDPDVSESVIMGLASHLEELKRPLCPCRFYPDKQQAVEERTWLCPCDPMKNCKYCHCMLFVTAEDTPVTEYLCQNHEGRIAYGWVEDPAPTVGRKGQHIPPGVSGKCC
ncbi:ferredoxin-thioredoxin reductase catalytic domain-containing protein [Pseudodesulfovibrio sp. zrk46]|uniref:ferredoxin-thioredoxin reductase catalytic domain-containing protein n=1 Tax=Pseudodesulfovibrio sp. zrk46 TaxID=2725288 RepID=UPI001449FED0|nr:ferredoxin-thioredoxin reductase catalytic domain-containing protein [Pseudodesulfovibrio sp. zrk46]QJB56043.1 ferredoxin:thioredoxin reductase [Pseudodesulfovibrio sp. zrk46]